MERKDLHEYAAELRRLGLHKLEQKEVERKLGRPLTTFERRALIYARDPRKKKSKGGGKHFDELKHSKTSAHSVQGGAPGLGKKNAGNTFTVKHGPVK